MTENNDNANSVDIRNDMPVETAEKTIVIAWYDELH